jgi:preprotein translocase subunit SecF
LFGIYSSVLVACPVALLLGVSRANLIGDLDKKKKAEGEGEEEVIA